MSGCACGIPNRANDHVALVVTNGFETTDVDIYTCAEHTPTEDHAADLLHPDIRAAGWSVIESKTTNMR